MYNVNIMKLGKAVKYKAMEKKRLSVFADVKLIQLAKIRAAELNITLTDFVVQSVTNELERTRNIGTKEE